MMPLEELNANDDPWVVFDYEVEMYFETVKANMWIIDQMKGRFPRVLLTIRNSLSESIVLHTRILIDILISKKKNKSNTLVLMIYCPIGVSQKMPKN